MDSNLRRLYADLAWIWPLISPPEDYIKEAEEFHHLFQTYSLGDVRSILHLGCGAGHLDHHLATRYAVTGIDLSAPMLAQARDLNPSAVYIQGDMRSTRLEEVFDAVILADSSDYLLTLDDLEAAFRTAFLHLRAGGVFYVYAEEVIERFENNQTQISRHLKDDFEIIAIENMYDPDPGDSTYEMTFVYLIRQAGELAIEIDRHVAGLFSVSNWIESLESSGFQVELIEYEEAGPGFIGRKPLTLSNIL